MNKCANCGEIKKVKPHYWQSVDEVELLCEGCL